MKSVKESLLDRTSIRRYEREPIPAETMEFIRAAVRNTPTSYNGQQFSVIEIDDQPLKEELYAITNQKQLKTCNRLLIFCSDYNKISMLAQRKGVEMPAFYDTMDGVTIGIIDASLAWDATASATCAPPTPNASPSCYNCPRACSWYAVWHSESHASSPTLSPNSPRAWCSTTTITVTTTSILPTSSRHTTRP